MDFSSQQEVTGKCLHHLSTKDDPHRNDFNLPECCTGSRQMKMECNQKKESEEDTLWEERMEKGAEMRSDVVGGRKRGFGWRSERREMATSEGHCMSWTQSCFEDACCKFSIVTPQTAM